MEASPESALEEDSATRTPQASTHASAQAERAEDAAHPGGANIAEAKTADDAAQAPDEQPENAPAQGPPATADESTTEDAARGVAWSVPTRWPLVSEEDEFRVRTWRLPAVSMAGAGECALYRFAGGGDPQDNLKRWIGEFRGPDGEVDSVEAAQAQRTIQGAPAWLVRAEGKYISQTPGDEDSKRTFDNYALFGAVIMAEGDPVFAKCVGPLEVITQEVNVILAWMDSMRVSAN